MIRGASSRHGSRNLRLALLRRHKFGPVRFSKRRGVVAGRPRRIMRGSAALPKRVTHLPPTACPRRSCDTRFEPPAWPYDTALPSGLPFLSEGPGSPDNLALLLRRIPIPTSTVRSSDQLGSRVDVII